MKPFSIKTNDPVFKETNSIKKILSKQLKEESKIVCEESMIVLKEFERLS